MACTFPFFRKWLNEQFGDLCQMHDEAYVARVWKLKVASDFELCSLMAARGYILLAYGAFIYVTTLGTVYWLWKKYK